MTTETTQNKVGYIDAHCHLADPRLDGYREALLVRARAAGISHFLQGGVDPDDWSRQLSLPSGCLPCFGLHPWFIDRCDEAQLLEALGQLASLLPQAAALGELGLDFGAKMRPERFALQRRLFRRQLQMARALQKPIVLHLVRCHGEAAAILREEGPQWRGMVHGFSASAEVARTYLKLGLALSVGGAVTRPGYKKLKSALKDIPEDRLIVESDAPDMAPANYPRAHNEPESIVVVAEAVGLIRGTSAHQVLSRSAANLVEILPMEGFL